MPRTAILSVALLTLLLFPPVAEGKRSFVGKKLPAGGWIDTEGHQILPRDYEDSVLVVYGGIPW